MAGRAVVQPRARVPGPVRRAERREPAGERLRAEAVLGVLPDDRAPRRRVDLRGAGRRRAVPGRRDADDRHADHGRLPAAARVPAAAGALGRLRPGAGRRRGDGQDQHGARHRARDRRSTGRAADPARIERRDRPRRRPLLVRPRPRCCTASTSHVPAGGCIALVGADRRRQVDAGQAGRPVLRPARGHGAGRRDRPARGAAAQLPAPARRRAAGSVPVLGHDRRQHPLRPARGERRGRAPTPRRRSASTSWSPGWSAGSSIPCARAARASRPASAS